MGDENRLTPTVVYRPIGKTLSKSIRMFPGDHLLPVNKRLESKSRDYLYLRSDKNWTGESTKTSVGRRSSYTCSKYARHHDGTVEIGDESYTDGPNPYEFSDGKLAARKRPAIAGGRRDSR